MEGWGIGVEGRRLRGGGLEGGEWRGEGVVEGWRGRGRSAYLKWAWRPGPDANGGSMKYMFRYLKCRICKTSHGGVSVSTIACWNVAYRCLFYTLKPEPKTAEPCTWTARNCD